MATTSAARPAPPRLTPGAFLVRGLAAGLIAGLVTFVVAFALGEPSVDRAIALEGAGGHSHGAAADDHDQGHDQGHDHGAADAQADEQAAGPGMVEVSRDVQRTWGLLTGAIVIGPALGGLAALAAAALVGRLGGLSARGSTALVALLGFVAVALVPFAKYPATPPAVGSGDTIGGRTAAYFAMLMISVLAMIAAVVLARHLATVRGVEPWTAAALAGLGYLTVVGVAAGLLPTVDELGDFPASVLWSFRRGSLLTLAALWASLGVVLVALVGRLHDRVASDLRRRELAASL
ncbi:CbtA family protein [Nocardioides sp.]|uniref:CbtA family protein n=1 Tax=Nocardioides sp. TaxID=35761 RepID=UPI00351846C6